MSLTASLRRHRRTLLAAALGPVAALALIGPAAAHAASAEDAPLVPAGTGVVQYQDWITIKPGSIVTPTARCPVEFPYLVRHQYTDPQSMTTVPLGIGLERPGHVGVSIMSATTVDGTFNGAAGSDASATNWDPFASARFRLVLHCTADPDEGYTSMKDLISGWIPLSTSPVATTDLPEYDPARTTAAYDG